MQNVNLLGLKAAGITVVILLALFGTYKAAQTLFFPEQSTTENESDFGAVDAEGQPDEWDHLVENLYQNEQDSLSREEHGLTASDFSEEDARALLADLNVPPPDTYTGQYLAQLPPDLPRSEVLDKDRITAFINEFKGQLLPPVTANDIIISDDSSPEAIETYLQSITPAHNPDLKHITSDDIEKAYILSRNDPTDQSLPDTLKALANNIDILLATPVPNDIASLHLKLVAASQALLDNVILLGNTPNDFIGGLIAAKRIGELGEIFKELDQEIQNLP